MTRLWVRTATALKTTSGPARQAGDFVRAWPSRDTRQNTGVLAIADASGCGFRSAFAAGASTLLEALDGTGDQRGVPEVTRGLSEGRQRFLDRTPSWTASASPEDLQRTGPPLLSYTVVSWNGTSAQCRWLGLERAELYRAFAQARGNAVTTEDTTAEPWELQPGDTLVLLSHGASPGLTREVIAYLAAAHASPVQLANALIERGVEGVSSAAVSIARFDDVDVPAAIGRCIDAYQAPAEHAHVAGYARRFRFLPLLWDEVGVSGLDEHGRIVTGSHAALAAEQRPQLWNGTVSARLAHLQRAAELHAELKCLAPRVPADGVPQAPAPAKSELTATQTAAQVAAAPKARRFWEIWKR